MDEQKLRLYGIEISYDTSLDYGIVLPAGNSHEYRSVGDIKDAWERVSSVFTKDQFIKKSEQQLRVAHVWVDRMEQSIYWTDKEKQGVKNTLDLLGRVLEALDPGN